MAAPEGFDWSQRDNGDVVITHRGKVATVLRGRKASEFTDEADGCGHDDTQELMARLTGNYKRGNERQARNHPRNRGR